MSLTLTTPTIRIVYSSKVLQLKTPEKKNGKSKKNVKERLKTQKERESSEKKAKSKKNKIPYTLIQPIIAVSDFHSLFHLLPNLFSFPPPFGLFSFSSSPRSIPILLAEPFLLLFRAFPSRLVRKCCSVPEASKERNFPLNYPMLGKEKGRERVNGLSIFLLCCSTRNDLLCLLFVFRMVCCSTGVNERGALNLGDVTVDWK